MANKIQTHEDLDVYKLAFKTAMKVYKTTTSFPREEIYSLTDQIRRSSRSVCANIGEGFRKRRYPKSFVSSLNISEAEAAETQVWLDFAFECKYIDEVIKKDLKLQYDYIIGKLVNMQRFPEKWSL